MKSVVGIFASRMEADRAVEQLRGVGVKNINLLAPSPSGSQIAKVPSVDAEQPGMGMAVGGVVGGALGAAGASSLIPGVGPVLAIGFIGAALLGAIVGAMGGAAAGGALENAFVKGLPADELYVYQDALKKGRTVLIAFVDDDKAEPVDQLLKQSGVESVDPARESWWIGLRDVREEEYAPRAR
jgi:hypothetical protein